MKMYKGRFIAWISLGLQPSLFLCRGRPTPCCSSLWGKDSLDPPSCFGQSRKLERKNVLYGSWSLARSYLISSLPVLLIIWIFQSSLSLSWPRYLNTSQKKQWGDRARIFDPGQWEQTPDLLARQWSCPHRSNQPQFQCFYLVPSSVIRWRVVQTDLWNSETVEVFLLTF